MKSGFSKMTKERKHMRIALSASDYEKFTAAKAQAQKSAKVVMTDPQFAISLIRWAVMETGDD